MGTKINTGTSLFNAPVNAPNTENQSTNVIFSANSTSLVSHTVLVDESAIVVKAYGLTSGETITVNMISNDGLSTLSTPMVINSKTVQLSTNNTCIVIDISGNYTFTLSSGLGSVSCVYHESGMAYWSYGLSHFAGAS